MWVGLVVGVDSGSPFAAGFGLVNRSLSGIKYSHALSDRYGAKLVPDRSEYFHAKDSVRLSAFSNLAHTLLKLHIGVLCASIKICLSMSIISLNIPLSQSSIPDLLTSLGRMFIRSSSSPKYE